MMLICDACHPRTRCRSEVHLDIVRGACERCGITCNCFVCDYVDEGRVKRIRDAQVSMYRNTKQLKAYRKINI